MSLITELPVTLTQHFERYTQNRSAQNLSRVQRALVDRIVDHTAGVGQDQDQLRRQIMEDYGQMLRSVIAHPSAQSINLLATANRIVQRELP